MSCDDVAAAIIDEGFPRPADFQSHLEQCPQCRELARLHASASALRLAGPPPLPPVPSQSILGEVRRRHLRRRAVAGAAVAGAIAAVVLFMTPRAEKAVPVTDAPVTELAELPRIDLLLEEVEGYTQRDLTFNDESYAAFGLLAVWVRTPEPTALDERPFRAALAPLHSSHSPIQEPAR